MFDPYHKWLGIPKAQRPPTHYQLLGIAPGETDTEVIEEAAIRQTAHLRAHQLGPHADVCTRLLNEVALARSTLLNPAKRRHYDQTLATASSTAVTRRATTITASPFDDLDDRTPMPAGHRSIRKRSDPGLWIGLGIAGVLGAVIVVGAVLLIHAWDQAHEADAAHLDPDVEFIQEKIEVRAKADTRTELLQQATAHWKLGEGAKHPQFPLLPAGEIEYGVAAEGPAAHPGAKVARLKGAYFDAGRELSPNDVGLTVYLRLRDPRGQWDYGLFAKRGNVVQLAFNLFSGPTPTGPIIGFEVRTDAGYGRVAFPVGRVDARAWHDLVGRYDGRKLQLICDGKVLAETALTGNVKQNEQEILIGAENVQGRPQRPFTGEMQEAALWTRGLSDLEVARLSSVPQLEMALAPAPPPPPPVVADGILEVKPGEAYRLGSTARFVLTTPDGRYALFQQPRGITVWGVAENRELRVLPLASIPIAHAAVSGDSKWLAVAIPVSKVVLWNLETGQLAREINHGTNVYSLALAPDGAKLATAGGRGTNKETDIKIWSVPDGELLHALPGHEAPPLSLGMNGPHIYSIDGRINLLRWDAKTGQLLGKLRPVGRLPFMDVLANGAEAAWLRPNRFVVEELETMREVRGCDLPPGTKVTNVFDVTADGRRGILTNRDKHELLVCDLVEGKVRQTLSGHQSPVVAVALTPDGRRAYSIDQSRLLRIWELD